MPEPLLRVEKLSVSVGGVRVVDEVSFEIRRGEIYGLCGESGCGKTTVALAILRLLRPPSMIDQGRVHWGTRDVLRFSEDELREFRWREVSLVTQGAMNALNPVMRVGDQMVHWEPGKCVVFDDFFHHEVWNDTDEERVVLIFDFERPMRLAGRMVNRFLMWGIKRTAYFQDAKRNLKNWDERLEAAVQTADHMLDDMAPN